MALGFFTMGVIIKPLAAPDRRGPAEPR